MNHFDYVKFLKYLAVALCSAIVSYLSSSCTSGFNFGSGPLTIDNYIYSRIDSTHLIPTLSF